MCWYGALYSASIFAKRATSVDEKTPLPEEYRCHNQLREFDLPDKKPAQGSRVWYLQTTFLIGFDIPPRSAIHEQLVPRIGCPEVFFQFSLLFTVLLNLF